MDLMPVGSVEAYAAALQQLFPQGEFWDEQFADPSSDSVSLVPG